MHTIHQALVVVCGNDVGHEEFEVRPTRSGGTGEASRAPRQANRETLFFNYRAGAAVGLANLESSTGLICTESSL